MERGQPVWLKSAASRWGWVPAIVHDREEVELKGITVIKITLRDDPSGGSGGGSMNDSPAAGSTASPFFSADLHRSNSISGGDGYYADIEPFEVTLTIDIDSAERDELDDIKIRDVDTSNVVGGVDDLI